MKWPQFPQTPANPRTPRAGGGKRGLAAVRGAEAPAAAGRRSRGCRAAHTQSGARPPLPGLGVARAVAPAPGRTESAAVTRRQDPSEAWDQTHIHIREPHPGVSWSTGEQGWGVGSPLGWFLLAWITALGTQIPAMVLVGSGGEGSRPSLPFQARGQRVWLEVRGESRGLPASCCRCCPLHCPRKAAGIQEASL